MQFKEAAFEILQKESIPLHYNEITNRAIAAGLLETMGQTPHATMGALLYTDTLNANSRFRRGDQRGTFALKATAPTGIDEQIEAIQKKVREDLRQRMSILQPQKFEELMRSLLEEMGFEETEVTQPTNDQGIDVRGVLKTNQLSATKVVIQVKRWQDNVSSEIVQKLRGSVNMMHGEHGIIVTLSDFTLNAKKEAQAEGRLPITLINGNELIELLIQYQVGVKQEERIINSIDTEYWNEVLEVPLVEQPITEMERVQAPRAGFPLAIEARHRGKTYFGEMLNLRGKIRLNGQEYGTPSGAAKAIATSWTQVNGWKFWRYEHPGSGEWEYISSLRAE